MSLTLQILLIIATVLFFIILVKNVKKGKLRTDYALAWILCSIALIILSIFPQIAFFAARLIGVIYVGRKTKKFNSRNCYFEKEK